MTTQKSGDVYEYERKYKLKNGQEKIRRQIIKKPKIVSRQQLSKIYENGKYKYEYLVKFEDGTEKIRTININYKKKKNQENPENLEISENSE